MNKRDLQGLRLMLVLFAIVFGPILLFSWKDWRDIIFLGIHRSSDVVDSSWNLLGSNGTPTLSSAVDSLSTPIATADFVSFFGKLLTPVDISTLTPRSTLSGSATNEQRLSSSQTPTRIPSRTPTARTPTRVMTRTPTLLPPGTLTPILTGTPPRLYSPTPLPTDTPVPTNTPRPPTSTRRPTQTPTPKPPPTATQPPIPSDPPPTVVPTDPTPSYP